MLMLSWIFVVSVLAPFVSAEAAAYKDAAFIEFFRRTNGIVACDGASSVPLSDGRVLWFFGDSYVDCYRDGTVPCLFQVRNVAMVHHKDDLQHVRPLLGKHGKSLFKNATNDETWFWPESGFQQSNSVYIYLINLKKAGSGPLGFAAIGRDYWGKMKFPELDTIDYIPLPSFNGIDFGAGFVPESDGRTYAFGHKRRGISVNLYLARFRTANPETNWTFWNGTDWSASVTNAAAITKQDATSVQVCKVKDRFLITTSQFSVGCDQGKEIYVATATAPTGPYSARKTIFTIDDTYEGHYPFFYLPITHPEFINPNDELLITYCINGYEPCARSCVDGRMNPDHYRPRAIRVPLKLLFDQ
ncbi:MAG TPA: DUF4185 domain-containing protein [Candidatus Binatia bacterium]|nr:DUF4185 domain-containing protein [Candidatus Binatia bacterium]